MLCVVSPFADESVRVDWARPREEATVWSARASDRRSHPR
jgi:hypothetical protein